MRLGRAASGWILALGVLCASWGAIFARLADEADPSVRALWRCTLGAAFFWLVCGRGPWTRSRRIWRAVIVAGVALAVHFASWIASLDMISVGASVALVSTVPLWAAGISVIFRLECPDGRLWFGAALAVVGAAVIGGQGTLEGGSALGYGLALLGAAAGGAYLVAGRVALTDLSVPRYAAACYTVAALTLAALCAAQGVPIVGFETETYGWLICLGIVSQILGHTSVNAALTRLTASTVAVALLAEPALATALAWRFFDEPPTVWLGVGAAVTVLGIAIVVWRPKSEADRDAGEARDAKR